MKRPWCGSHCRGTGSVVTGDSGQALVETALSLLIAITISFAVFEASILMYSYCAFNEAVREGVRFASMHGTSSPAFSSCASSAASVQSTVANATRASFQTIDATADVIVTYNPSGTCAPNTSVTVSISKAYVPVIGFLGITPKLTVRSQGRIIY